MTDQETQAAQQRLDAAVRFAREAGGETLKFFLSKDLQIESKADSSPVTAADRAAETLLRERIDEFFPDDAILGEEFGEKPGSSGYRWVLDPIDGTKSFIHGAPLYTTLVAVMRRVEGNERPILGVIHAPATQETVYARVGGGAWSLKSEGKPEKTAVNRNPILREGLLLTTDVAAFAKYRPTDATDAYLALQNEARLARTWGDAYGYLMVATGRAEAMLDPALSLWDAAALQPIIEEAGGRFTDWQGEPTVHTGDAVATNGLVHDEVLRHTRGR